MRFSAPEEILKELQTLYPSNPLWSYQDMMKLRLLIAENSYTVRVEIKVQDMSPSATYFLLEGLIEGVKEINDKLPEWAMGADVMLEGAMRTAATYPTPEVMQKLKGYFLENGTHHYLKAVIQFRVKYAKGGDDL